MTETNKSNIEVIRGMTHEEFLESKKSDKTLQFHFDNLIFSDERKFLKGAGKVIFYLFLFGYMLGPVIITPFIAYSYDNWYLLFGILFSYFSTFLALKNKKTLWVLALIYLVWYWVDYGFHLNDYPTFFGLSFIWGSLIYQFAINTEDEYAKVEILKNSELFNSLSQKGIIYFMKKNAEKKETQSSEGYILMGRMKFDKENFKGAILDFDKAIEISPNYGKAYLNRALAKNETEDYEGAINDFDTAIKLSPKDGIGYFGRGISNLKNGNKIAAREDWNKAGELGFEAAYDLIKNQLD